MTIEDGASLPPQTGEHRPSGHLFSGLLNVKRAVIARAHELLGWKPHTPLKLGLRRTIAYFERLLADHAAKRLLAVEVE